MKRILSLIMIFLIILPMFAVLAPKVLAAENVIFQDDFETYQAEAFPSGGWKLVYNGAGNQYQVITSDYAASGTKSLQMVGQYGWSAVVAKDFSSISNLIGFEAYLMGTPGSWPSVGFGNETIQPWGRLYGAVGVDTIDGYIVAGSQNLQPCTTNTWYKIRVVMDRNARTFDIWIDDQLKGTNIPEPNDPWEIQSLRFDVGWHNVMNYYDNVKVFEVSGPSPPETAWDSTLYLDSGSGTFASVSAANPTIYVSSGQLLSGTITLIANNNIPPNCVVPLIGTPSWGEHSTSWWLIHSWLPYGSSIQTTNVQLYAPSQAGIYYIIFAFRGELTGEQMASATNWPLGYVVWNDGNDIADFSSSQISEAQQNGVTVVNWLYTDGYKPTYTPACAIKVVVGETPPQTGSISGVVFYLDSEGDVVKVADAVVSVDYPSWTAISNAEGEYRLDNLPFGLWVVTCVKPGYGFPQRDEIAIIDCGHPEAVVNFCMKAEIIEDLKETELQTMDLIDEWLLNAGRALDDAATEYNAEVVHDTLMLGLDALITKEGGTELNRWVAEKYLPIEGVTKNLAQIINTHHFTGETGYYEICFKDSLEEYKSEIENSYSSEFIASMFKEPKPVDQSIKILVDDAKIFLSKLLDFTSSTCVCIKNTIMSYNLDQAEMMQELDIPQKILTIGGTSLVIASCPASIILLGCAVPGVAELGEGLLIAAGVVQIIATVIRAHMFGEAYNGLVPLYLRVVEQSRCSLREISDAMDSICNYIFSKNQDNLQFPTIESELLASPYVRIVNTWTEDIECNTAYIMQLSVPALEGINGFQSSYIYRSEGPSFILSVGGLGEILPLKKDYSDDIINWFVDIQSKIEVPVDVVVSSDLYVIYGQPAKPVGAKKYTTNYHETLVPLRSVEITVYSPCDLHVYDQAGRHVGYTYHDGGAVCEIPKSFYLIEDEKQHVIIVNASGAYRIELRGTSNGEYHLNIKSVFATVVESEQWINGTITSGQTLDYYVYVDPSGVPIFYDPFLTTSISPLSSSILIGQSVTFSCMVNGGISPYSYQWYLNGNPVSSATSNAWTFTSATSGIYYVHLKVTDAEGNTVQSETARITVATVPVGGYSIPIQIPTKTEPITLYIALTAIITLVFTTIKRKTTRKPKHQ